jgi:multidrug efflux pump
VDLTLRQNASIFATEAGGQAAPGDDSRGDPDVDHFSTYVGRGAIRFYLPLNVQLANPFFSQFVVVAKDLEARERLHDGSRCWPRSSPASSRASIRSSWARRSAGRCSTASPARTRTRCASLALEFANAMVGRRARAARQLRLDGAGAADARARSTRTRRASSASARPALPAVLNAAVTGTVVTQVRDDIYLVNVMARATDGERLSFESLASLQVPTPAGAWCRSSSSPPSPRSRSSRWSGAATACRR